MIPRGFGLRQPSAAFERAMTSQSGRGLPQSKTLTRHSFARNRLGAIEFLKPLLRHKTADLRCSRKKIN